MKQKGYNNVITGNGNDLAQKFKFNGKEIQDELNLDLYHYGARFYDPAIGLFTTIDPKAEDYMAQSPYVYAANSPIAFEEKNGENPILGILKKLAKQGVKYAAKNLKGQLKPISRKQAKKMLQNKQSVFKTTGTNAKSSAKKLMKEAANGKRVVKDKGHDLVNKQGQKTGKKGLDHFQKKSGDGSHVFLDNAKNGTVALIATSSDANTDPSSDTSESDSGGDVIDSVVDNVKDAVPSMAGAKILGNAGKSVFGDGSVGNFVDDWLNPFGIVDDLNTLTILGTATTINQQETKEEVKEDN